MQLTYEKLKEMVESKGHTFFDEGIFNVNLIGIRLGYDTVDEFNDVLAIAFRDENGNPTLLTSKATTKPGLHWLKNRMGNMNGTAILCPGQYFGCWTIGKHKGYEALVQNGLPFKVWRDNDKDGKLDTQGKVYVDVTGLNMHTTSFISEIDRVGAYSAGCQVRQHSGDHEIAMAILKRSADLYGNKFSYTLIES